MPMREIRKESSKQPPKADRELPRMRAERQTPQLVTELPVPKTKPIEKKKEVKAEKEKQEAQPRPQGMSKFVSVEGMEPFPEAVVRSRRSRLLSSK